jgi:hypothetical protein
METMEFLKSKRFSVITTYGNYYAQETDVEFFETIEDAERCYNETTISEAHMESCDWSRDGEQPTFSIELRELKSPVSMLEELEEDAEEMESEMFFLDDEYSIRLKIKSYFFNDDAVIDRMDSEEEKAEKNQMNRWLLVEEA